MKTKISLKNSLRNSLLVCGMIPLVSCSSFEHPLTRHDMDGDGALSHSEYQQNAMQYNMARRQRVDEYDRARQIYRHVDNVNDILYGANRGLSLLSNFGKF